MTRAPNTTEDGGLACAFGEKWMGRHPLCAAESARLSGRPIDEIPVPDWSHLAEPPKDLIDLMSE